MRTPGMQNRESLYDDAYFERKARELVVADDEIEAWEFDSRELGSLADFTDDDFGLPKLD